MERELFHGTTLESGKKIIQDNSFTYKEKDIHYLGQGVYFYDDVGLAERWSKVSARISDNKCVLVANIEVNEEDILDLRKETDIDLIKPVYDNIISKTKAFIKKDADYELRLRCYLYDCICKDLLCKLLIARISADRMYFNLGLCDSALGDLQYCVKDISIIGNTKIKKVIPYTRRYL